MATATQNFGTNTALTVTNLHSLGNGSWWQSAAIDNGTVKGFWLELFVTILTTTTAGSDGTVDVYYAGSTDGGTDFAGGASGSEGSYTVTGNSDEQLQLIASIPIDASETTARTYKWRGVVDNIGEDFAILIENNTGTALGVSTNAVEYRLHKYDSA
jgi:hypothetical protein